VPDSAVRKQQRRQGAEGTASTKEVPLAWLPRFAAPERFRNIPVRSSPNRHEHSTGGIVEFDRDSLAARALGERFDSTSNRPAGCARTAWARSAARVTARGSDFERVVFSAGFTQSSLHAKSCGYCCAWVHMRLERALASPRSAYRRRTDTQQRGQEEGDKQREDFARQQSYGVPDHDA
jgi:hypothetical protein